MDVEHRPPAGHTGIRGPRLAARRGIPAERNLADLEEHADEFERRVAFAYSVLEPDSDNVIGCVYIDPGDKDGNASIRSWVRADVAELDAPLRKAIRDWLTESWPFNEIAYADE